MSESLVLSQEVGDGGTTVRGSETVTHDQKISLSPTIPASSTNLQHALAFVNAKLKSFCAHATVDMTLHTNEASTGTPQEKLTLKAGLWFQWSLTGSWLGEVGESAASPFDGDVTSLFVTSTLEGILTIKAIVDPT